MKKLFLLIGCSAILTSKVVAQNPPSFLNPHLAIYLEVQNTNGSNFIPHHQTTPVTPAIWLDQSGNGNDVSTVNSPNVTSHPFLVQTGSGPAVHFDRTPMWNPGMSSGVLNGTEATIFVVRTAQTAGEQVDPAGGGGAMNNPYHSIVSVAGRSLINGVATRTNVEEFGVGGDIALHHTQNGAYAFRQQACFSRPQSNLPNNLPVVLCGSFGDSPADFDYWVNGVKSNMGIVATGNINLANYTNVDRDWCIGGRFDLNGNMPLSEMFTGDVYEVLVYDTRLRDEEIALVHEYLKCKYAITYDNGQCNQPSECCNNLSIVGSEIDPGRPIGLNFDVTFNGADPVTGECQFTATVLAGVAQGWNIQGFEWDIPGVGLVTTQTNQPTDTQTFTLPQGTPVANVSVRLLSINANYRGGKASWCCNKEVSSQVSCTNGTGEVTP